MFHACAEIKQAVAKVEKDANSSQSPGPQTFEELLLGFEPIKNVLTVVQNYRDALAGALKIPDGDKERIFGRSDVVFSQASLAPGSLEEQLVRANNNGEGARELEQICTGLLQRGSDRQTVMTFRALCLGVQEIDKCLILASTQSDTDAIAAKMARANGIGYKLSDMISRVA